MYKIYIKVYGIHMHMYIYICTYISLYICIHMYTRTAKGWHFGTPWDDTSLRHPFTPYSCLVRVKRRVSGGNVVGATMCHYSTPQLWGAAMPPRARSLGTVRPCVSLSRQMPFRCGPSSGSILGSIYIENYVLRSWCQLSACPNVYILTQIPVTNCMNFPM